MPDVGECVHVTARVTPPMGGYDELAFQQYPKAPEPPPERP